MPYFRISSELVAKINAQLDELGVHRNHWLEDFTWEIDAKSKEEVTLDAIEEMTGFRNTVKRLSKEVSKLKYHKIELNKIKFVALKEYVEAKELSIDE